jgi:L,D-peptidoglycan transpeptidase YkuD (ErfK/YbiS/YcfS/YnhG family)
VDANDVGVEQLDVFLINYLHWWCNVPNNKKYYNEQSNISYSLYIYSISSLEEKSWIQSLGINVARIWL